MARYELVSMVLSVRAALFVVVYAISAGGVGRLFLFLDEKSNGALTKGAADAVANREVAIKALEEQKIPTAVFDAILSANLPAVLLFVLFFSTFVIPGLVLLIGYGAIGEDLHTRYARYLLQRVRRGSFLAGKIAAHFAVSFLGIVVAQLLLLAAAQTLDNFDNELIIEALPRVWLAMAIFTLGYVAFTSVLSALIKPPFAAFALGLMVLAVLWVVSKIPPIDRVWMGAVDIELWALTPYAISIYMAHAVVFLGIAWFGLQRRDV